MNLEEMTTQIHSENLRAAWKELRHLRRQHELLCIALDYVAANDPELYEHAMEYAEAADKRAEPARETPGMNSDDLIRRLNAARDRLAQFKREREGDGAPA